MKFIYLRGDINIISDGGNVKLNEVCPGVISVNWKLFHSLEIQFEKTGSINPLNEKHIFPINFDIMIVLPSSFSL